LGEISISEQWPEFWDWLPLLPPANCHSKFMQRHQEKHPLAGSQLNSYMQMVAALGNVLNTGKKLGDSHLWMAILEA